MVDNTARFKVLLKELHAIADEMERILRRSGEMKQMSAAITTAVNRDED